MMSVGMQFFFCIDFEKADFGGRKKKRMSVKFKQIGGDAQFKTGRKLAELRECCKNVFETI